MGSLKGTYKAGTIMWASYFKLTDDEFRVGRDCPPFSFTLTADVKSQDLTTWNVSWTLREKATLHKKVGTSDLNVFETEEEALQYYNSMIDHAVVKAKGNAEYFQVFAKGLESRRNPVSKPVKVKVISI